MLDFIVATSLGGFVLFVAIIVAMNARAARKDSFTLDENKEGNETN